MCGRFTHKFTWRELRDLLSKGEWPARLAEVGNADLFNPRYNVAPSQDAAVVRVTLDANGKVGGLEVGPMRWGLVPFFSKDAKAGPINARAESVATNGLFRNAFAKRRCVVPVSGFYEWKKTTLPTLIPGAEPEEGPKRPHFISRADGQPLLMAGLWERWGRGEECIETFAVITTTANTFMSEVHDRMPVVLEPEAVPSWLDPQNAPAALQGLLTPAADGVLQMHEVSPRVGNPRNQGPELVQPA